MTHVFSLSADAFAGKAARLNVIALWVKPAFKAFAGVMLAMVSFDAAELSHEALGQCKGAERPEQQGGKQNERRAKHPVQRQPQQSREAHAHQDQQPHLAHRQTFIKRRHDVQG
ncbi:hypothetical protein VCRA2120E57_610003 [Vibrio crassostreae]|nr:hypothetical protein VCRA2120E57_610003 [Vibrio crassostreae]